MRAFLLLAALITPALVAAGAAWGRKVGEQRAATAKARRRPERFVQWVEAEREKAHVAALRLEGRRDRAEAVARRFAETARSIRDDLPGERDKSLAWVITAAIAVGALWVLALASEIGVDAQAFWGLGYAPTMAIALAWLVALGFSLIGLVLAELVGLTRVLHGVQRLRRSIRGALIAYTVLLLALSASQLPRLAQYRSEPIAAKVRGLEQTRSALARLPEPDPLLVEEVDRQLSAETAKLNTARYADRRLAVVAAVVEVATSWAALWLLVLLGYAAASGLAARHRRQAHSAKERIRILDARLWAKVAKQAEGLSISLQQLPTQLQAARLDSLLYSIPSSHDSPGPSRAEEQRLNGQVRVGIASPRPTKEGP